MAPPPPVVVTIPILFPSGSFLFLKRLGTSMRDSKICTLLIPLYFIKALNASSDPAIAPV